MANDKDVTSYFSEVDLQAFALVTLTILVQIVTKHAACSDLLKTIL